MTDANEMNSSSKKDRPAEYNSGEEGRRMRRREGGEEGRLKLNWKFSESRIQPPLKLIHIPIRL